MILLNLFLLYFFSISSYFSSIHLQDVPTGFFVEAGALDGEWLSNTLALEKRGWTGLLVEADPRNYEALLKKKRKVRVSGESCYELLYLVENLDHEPSKVKDK